MATVSRKRAARGQQAAGQSLQSTAPPPPPPPPPPLAARAGQNLRPNLPPPPPPLPTFTDLSDSTAVQPSRHLSHSHSIPKPPEQSANYSSVSPSIPPPPPAFQIATPDYPVSPPQPPPPPTLPPLFDQMSHGDHDQLQRSNPPQMSTQSKRAHTRGKTKRSENHNSANHTSQAPVPPAPSLPFPGMSAAPRQHHSRFPSSNLASQPQIPPPPPPPPPPLSSPELNHASIVAHPMPRIPESPAVAPVANGHPPHAAKHAQNRPVKQQHHPVVHSSQQKARKKQNKQHRKSASSQQAVTGPHVVVPDNLTPDSSDVTPVQLMAMACEQLDWWRIMTLARQHGPVVTTVHAGDERLTALHHAVLNDKREYAFQLAVHCAAPTNAVDVYGDTPLIVAVQNCHNAIAQMLVKDAKADPTIVGRFGLTALHWCCEMDSEMDAARCAELLLSHGADPSIEDEAGKTPLHWAALCGKSQLSALLLLKGGMATIDSRDAAGRTPLFNAADKGHDAIIKLLLQRGARATVTDINGVSPYEAAKRSGHSECAKLLKKFKNVKPSGPPKSVHPRGEQQQERSQSNFVTASNCVQVSDTAVLGTGGLSDSISASSWDDGASARSRNSKNSAKHGKSGSKCTIQ